MGWGCEGGISGRVRSSGRDGEYIWRGLRWMIRESRSERQIDLELGRGEIQRRNFFAKSWMDLSFWFTIWVWQARFTQVCWQVARYIATAQTQFTVSGWIRLYHVIMCLRIHLPNAFTWAPQYTRIHGAFQGVHWSRGTRMWQTWGPLTLPHIDTIIPRARAVVTINVEHAQTGPK